MARRYKNPYIFAPAPTLGSRFGCLFFAVLFLIIALAVVVVISLGNNQQIGMTLETVNVWGLDKDLEGTRILHLSDLNGAHFKKGTLSTSLGSKGYKAVVMTGDMVGKKGDYEPMLALIRELKESVPVLFIAGNNDPSPIVTTAHGDISVYADWVQAAIDAGAVYLDAPYALEISGETVWFCPEYHYSLDINSARIGYQYQREAILSQGQENTADGAAALRALDYRDEVLTHLETARKTMKEKDVQIMVTHEPVTVYDKETLTEFAQDDVMAFNQVDLILSGHYCNGQWRVPIWDQALYIPQLGWFPEASSYTGMSWLGSTPQHISPGLGASGDYPFQPGRVFNKPEATLITFTGSSRK